MLAVHCLCVEREFCVQCVLLRVSVVGVACVIGVTDGCVHHNCAIACPNNQNRACCSAHPHQICPTCPSAADGSSITPHRISRRSTASPAVVQASFRHIVLHPGHNCPTFAPTALLLLVTATPTPPNLPGPLTPPPQHPSLLQPCLQVLLQPVCWPARWRSRTQHRTQG